MVKKIKKSKNQYFQCEECNFVYKDRKIAEECEAYCKKNHACSTEITRHAIKIWKMAKDPICGMEIDEKKAEFSVIKNNKKYYFCSKNCYDAFNKK